MMVKSNVNRKELKMSDSGEMIDIYDDSRVLTGTALPRKAKLSPGQYMLYVYALISDRNGRYLVTRRALTKKWAAGSWEVPGGGAMAGETSLAAIQREVFEETGLDISKDDVSVIYSYKNTDNGGDNYFADIYLVNKDFSLEEVKLQGCEVSDVKLASLKDIEKLHDCDGFLHYERIMTALKAKS